MLLHEILENGKKGDVALIDSKRRLTYGELKENIRTVLSLSARILPLFHLALLLCQLTFS